MLADFHSQSELLKAEIDDVFRDAQNTLFTEIDKSSPLPPEKGKDAAARREEQQEIREAAKKTVAEELRKMRLDASPWIAPDYSRYIVSLVQTPPIPLEPLTRMEKQLQKKREKGLDLSKKLADRTKYLRENERKIANLKKTIPLYFEPVKIDLSLSRTWLAFLENSDRKHLPPQKFMMKILGEIPLEIEFVPKEEKK